MSNAQRPNLARKSTPKTEKARKEALDEDFSIRIDGTVYTIVPADLTGLLEMKVRRDTGMTVAEIVTKLQDSPGLDLLGAFMYSCELAAGRDADYEGILGSISYASDIEVVDSEGSPVPQP